jgi:hypothetical protein
MPLEQIVRDTKENLIGSKLAGMTHLNSIDNKTDTWFQVQPVEEDD